MREANNVRLNYDVAVADNHLWQYHRDNGFSKLSLVDGNISTAVLRVLEGQVEAASLINKAYISNVYENTTVMTGINFYPYK